MAEEKAILKSAAHEEGYKEGMEIGEQQGYSEYQEMFKKPNKLFKVQKKII